MSAWAEGRGGDIPRAHLKAWRLIRTAAGIWHLVGVVVGHVRLADGHVIVTSDIVDVHVTPDPQIRVETVNTLYALGEPRPGELPVDYRALVDAVLGQPWETVEIGDL